MGDALTGDGWRRFLAREEFRRHRYGAFVPANATTDLQHGDLECRFTFPVPDGRTESFIDFPWLRANRETEPAPYLVLTTDLKEDDVVVGALAKAEAALRLAVQETPTGGRVALNSACVPELTGEDLDPMVRRHSSRVPVMFRPSRGEDMVDLAIREALVSDKKKARPRRPRRSGVVLIGYPAGRAQAEIRRWLAGEDIRVVSCLLPCLSQDCLRRASRAALLVVAEDRLLEDAARKMTGAFSAATISPPAPYGFDGVLRWLRAVVEAGAPARRGLIQEEQISGLAARWQALTKQAQGHRLGFVLAPADLRRISEPYWNAGIPLLPLLQQMGFGVDLLIYAEKMDQTRLPRPRHPEQCTVQLFRTPKQLEASLRNGRFAAVYSDFTFDHRLTRCGKGRFSLSFFEPGLEGAIRSLERLLGLCRLTFYRDHAGRLS